MIRQSSLTRLGNMINTAVSKRSNNANENGRNKLK